MQYRLTEITPLNHDVTRLTLSPASGVVESFLPGQYLEIVLADGKVRCAYSIACAPRVDGSLELHVRAMPHSDNYVLLSQHLNIGTLLEITLPFGRVHLPAGVTSAGPLLLLAGSTGFSQAKAFIEQWLQQGAAKPLLVYWGGRTRQDLYLNDWMKALADQHTNLRYVPVVSDDNEWTGRKGFVHKAVLEDIQDFTGYTVFGCGSPPMVYAAYDDFTAAGMKPEQLLSDVFAYAPR